jgi:hypothetical protein
LHGFVSAIETQIWDIFFGKLSGFGGRTIGGLFGFTEIDRLWQRGEFEDAVTVVMGQAVAKRDSFEHFLKALWRAVEDSHFKQPANISYCIVSVPKVIEPNPTARFAVALMRWFLIWLDERRASVLDCFALRNGQ